MFWNQQKSDQDSLTCPYTAHKRRCRELRAHCPKWIRVLGKNPQTGADVEEWACADSWLPILMIENTKINRETGAAVESARNEFVRVGENTAQRMAALLQTSALLANPVGRDPIVIEHAPSNGQPRPGAGNGWQAE